MLTWTRSAHWWDVWTREPVMRLHPANPIRSNRNAREQTLAMCNISINSRPPCWHSFWQTQKSDLEYRNPTHTHKLVAVLVYSYSLSMLGRFPVFSPRAIKQQLRLLTPASTPGLSHYKKHSLTRCALLRRNANTPLVSQACRRGGGVGAAIILTLNNIYS